MDSTLLALITLVIGALLGAGAAWFAASRPVEELRERVAAREGEAKELDEKFRRAGSELATMSERAARADGLADELTNVREKHRQTEVALERLRTEADARSKADAARMADREEQFKRELTRLSDAEEKLQAKFNEIGEKLLSGAQTRFLEDAQKQLGAMNKESLEALDRKVGPVGETLERYRKRVEEIEKGRTEAWHQLQGVIGEVKAGQREVIDGANRITTTLQGATKARGDWGELQFENLLDSCGLRDKTDFRREANVKNDEGADLRPDAIINIPGGRKLIVDVKNVFNTYKEANEAETEEQRGVLLVKHAKEVRGHVQALSAKRYQDHVEGSADFVVMFVPGEHVLYAAMMQDEGLLNYALERGVVLSSPLNFMSIALTVATVWRQAGVQADAEEIADLGKQLYDRLAVVAGHLSNLRRDLGKANKSFDGLVGSFDTNLRKAGERFEKLSVNTDAKEMVEALPLNTQPRRLMNFADEDSAGEIEADGS
ncbi:MAG: DNA recombination protein RmuC [Pseudomonadota bacterium]